MSGLLHAVAWVAAVYVTVAALFVGVNLIAVNDACRDFVRARQAGRGRSAERAAEQVVVDVERALGSVVWPRLVWRFVREQVRVVRRGL